MERVELDRVWDDLLDKEVRITTTEEEMEKKGSGAEPFHACVDGDADECAAVLVISARLHFDPFKDRYLRAARRAHVEPPCLG